MCYYRLRATPEHAGRPAKELHKLCKKTRVGCLACGGVHVCKDCAPGYAHDLVPKVTYLVPHTIGYRKRGTE